MQPIRKINQISSSGVCQLCNQEISRRSYLDHLERCLQNQGRERSEEKSLIIHAHAKADSRYYLIILARPDVTYYALNNIFLNVLRAEGDPSSRFQFRNQYYFSHMNDGFPGMNHPISASPLMHEPFLYLLYTGGWFPTLLTGELMGEIPYTPKGEQAVEILAYSIPPEDHHRWPQRPDKSQ